MLRKRHERFDSVKQSGSPVNSKNFCPKILARVRDLRVQPGGVIAWSGCIFHIVRLNSTVSSVLRSSTAEGGRICNPQTLPTRRPQRPRGIRRMPFGDTAECATRVARPETHGRAARASDDCRILTSPGSASNPVASAILVQPQHWRKFSLLRNSQQPGATRDFARVYLSPFSPMKSGYSWIVPRLASALLKP